MMKFRIILDNELDKVKRGRIRGSKNVNEIIGRDKTLVSMNKW